MSDWLTYSHDFVSSLSDKERETLASKVCFIRLRESFYAGITIREHADTLLAEIAEARVATMSDQPDCTACNDTGLIECCVCITDDCELCGGAREVPCDCDAGDEHR